MLRVDPQACWEGLATQYYCTCFQENLEFSTTIQTNVELAGFKETSDKILQTGFNENVLPQSAGPCKRMFASFLRPRIREFFIAEAKFSYLSCFEPILLSHYLATFPRRYIGGVLLDFSNVIDIVIFYCLTCVFKAPRIYYQLFARLFLLS